MPIIENYYYTDTIIKLELNLHKGEGFIYQKGQEEYLDWIPYDFELVIGENKYVLRNRTFSLEGLKILLNKMRAVIDEKNKTNMYRKYRYCSSENEFEISFENTNDYFEKEIILTEVWINGACLSENSSGYSIGYRFIVKFEILEEFLKGLEMQLESLLRE